MLKTFFVVKVSDIKAGERGAIEVSASNPGSGAALSFIASVGQGFYIGQDIVVKLEESFSNQKREEGV